MLFLNYFWLRSRLFNCLWIERLAWCLSSFSWLIFASNIATVHWGCSGRRRLSFVASFVVFTWPCSLVVAAVVSVPAAVISVVNSVLAVVTAARGSVCIATSVMILRLFCIVIVAAC